MRYANPDSPEPAARILCPYGLFYGGRGWLVAHVDQPPDMRLWRLDRIASVDLLDRGFVRREDFSIATYTAQSFGVFQEDPIDVVLRFEPDAADDAECWLFHPSQTMERAPDGSLIVRIRAGGVQEMCWHLSTWGSWVTIKAPDSMRTALIGALDSAAHHHKSQLQAATIAEHKS